MRSGKDPFTVVSPETTVAQDVLHGNVGNHLYSHAVHKTLLVPGTEIVSNATLSETRAATADDVARTNERFDAFVVPLANAFRPGFRRRLRNLTDFIRELEIPVVVVGVGIQVDGLHDDETQLDYIAPEVTDFVSAVLDRSASIGVRGEMTKRYLSRLGFPSSAVSVIGCPSLFLQGRDLTLPTETATLDRDSPITVSFTPGVEKIAEILERQATRYPRLTYIAQDRRTLELLLWGENPRELKDPRAPVHTAHPLYQQDRMRIFLDPWPWLDFVSRSDFAFGTRFHGCVAAILAGTPALLLAHDSRTVELAEYHGMPHRAVNEVAVDVDAAELLEMYDPTEFNGVHGPRFDTYLDFLQVNGLAHIHQPGNENPEFDAKVARTSYPDAVRTLCAPPPDSVASRLRWLRDSRPFDQTQHEHAYHPPFPHPAPPRTPDAEAWAALDSRLDTLDRMVAEQRTVIDKQRKRLDRQQLALSRQHQQVVVLQEQLAKQIAQSRRPTLKERVAKVLGLTR